MYVAIVLLLTVILPLASIAIQFGSADLIVLVGKWFTFWGVGIRLLLASATQMIKPQTTLGILGIEAPNASVVVRELGFANFALGAIATASLIAPAWLLPAACAAGLFLVLCGIQHAMVRHRGTRENVAMATDLIVGAAALLFAAVQLVR
ncbi:hypothetical protein GJW-30_1_02016 [Variibacter gotjawalensis]|uniref:Uncharacterized protein n=1 Tax=Variibacter gotjawalensis TaxID=1333996 RepID=A0A0S3PU99_9BRAD|nr:hypothetical protein [Variibacter gotjawalensis]NIK49806.1 hypothetical protein [Variibacter gotjawalensis]RZS45810.1 hypothetical protein EV661_4134 [Variibacter gotjawalensis]BAT59483.1 hypothetical protein GJW-30_1_02016 [Variibacter gotjawalensis]